MRKKRLLANMAASFLFQLTSIVSTFIIPRFIMTAYGSEVNGLLQSIAKFLSIISFLELGVGTVVQSALYKPLADKDNAAISRIVVSAGKFFNRLAVIMLGYIAVLMAVYPFVSGQSFGWVYTATMIAAISISTFAQYYFGIVDRLLLTADQHGYVHYIAQSVTLVLNTIACVVLIQMGASVHMVKLTTSLIYVVRPIFLRGYVNRHYAIDRRIRYEGEPIRQKWNGAAQHVAAVVLDGTDTIVLTLFSTLSAVSVYSAYNLVTMGVKTLFASLTSGVRSLMGELWAQKKLDELRRLFGWTEWLIHTGAVVVFGCTAELILPFVTVYTQGINDADYYQPLFALLITLAQAGHSLRLPYHTMILVGGHYKQTQHNYIIAAVMNIVISIAAVKAWGLVGVAIGTLCAMIYQTVWMAWYVSRNLLKWPMKTFGKQIALDVLIWMIAHGLSGFVSMNGVSYAAWIVQAVQIAVIWLTVIVGVNLLLSREYILRVFLNVFKRRV